MTVAQTSEPEPSEAMPDGTRWRFQFTVWFVALTAGLFNLLNYHGYPLFQAEVGIVVAGLAATAAIMAALRKAAGPRIGFIFSALFLAIVTDLSTSIDLGWFYGLWAVLALAAWFAESAILKLSVAAFGSVLMFQAVALTTGIGAPVRPDNYAKTLQPAGRPAADRPAIVHLVLDSYLGLDGMAMGPEHYTRLRAEQSAFFTGRGFQVYPQAYSRHVKTINSLPHLFSYGKAPLATDNRQIQHPVPEELAYFADLDRLGYRTSVVAPTFVDFCVNQPLTSCRKFDHSGLRPMLDSGLPAGDRAKLIGFTMLRLTSLASFVAERIQLTINDWFGTEGRRPYNRSQLLPMASLPQFDQMIRDAQTIERGEARLYHLLLPHEPYMLTRECTFLRENLWLDEHGPGSVTAREKGYAAHVMCVQKKISELLDALDQTEAGREAIVIVHGDHGSRISPVAPYLGGPELTNRELAMSHSTFFGIRVPGEAAGEVRGQYELGELLGGFMDKDFAGAPRPAPSSPFVYIIDAQWVPRERRPLPDFK